MELGSIMPTMATGAASPINLAKPTPSDAQMGEAREVFNQFVGETFYGQMLSSLRSSVGKPAYFHGGRAEEVFQGQLDQTLAEQFTKSGHHDFSGSMFELFQLQRR